MKIRFICLAPLVLMLFIGCGKSQHERYIEAKDRWSEAKEKQPLVQKELAQAKEMLSFIDKMFDEMEAKGTKPPEMDREESRTRWTNEVKKLEDQMKDADRIHEEMLRYRGDSSSK